MHIALIQLRPVFLSLALTLLAFAPAHAVGSLAVTAAPDVIYADGKSTTLLTATVRDGSNPAPDGTSVRFTTTLGTLTPDTAVTASGVARVSLTSAGQAGTATVTATAFAARAEGSSTGSAAVEFTEDRESLFDKDARWIRIDCPQYLIYSADMKIVEAQGKNGSAHLSFKALDITAESIQVDLLTETVLAHGATLQRGRHVLRVAELHYDLATAAGTAILTAASAQENSSVIVTGPGLETTPQPVDPAQGTIESNPYRFTDLSDSHVVVSARAITAAPGDQIQFRRATIYSDGKKLLSVPYHVMPMNTDQLFGQQLLGIGSQGIFLNVPFYYNVTPRSKGTIYLRNAAVNGTSIGGQLSSGTSFFSTHPAHQGLALDLEQSYDVGRGGSGLFLVNGITQSQWGAQWSHTQRIDEATSGYLFIDYPSHRSLYASSNLSRQFQGFSLNMTASGSRDPGSDGFSASSTNVAAYIQTNPRPLGRSPVQYSVDLAQQKGTLTETAPDTGTVVTRVSTTALDVRLFTNPLRPDRHTVVTPSLSLGQAWSATTSSLAPTVDFSLGLTRTFRNSDSLTLNYTYRYDPLLSRLGSYSTGLNPLEALLRSNTQQRLTATYNARPLPRVSVSFSGSYGLPLNDRTLFATSMYRVNNDWGLGLAANYEQYVLNSYRDVEYLVSRRILGRDLVFYYSTKTKKLNFDFAGAAFN